MQLSLELGLATLVSYLIFQLAFPLMIIKTEHTWTHVKEIPNTKLLVSLHHNREKSANLEIYDISNKAHIRKIYSLGEVSGSKINS